MEYSDTAIKDFQKHFTSYHFQDYPAKSGDFTHSLDIYQINIQLCEAFYPCLHTIEIALRHSIHNELKGKYGMNWFLTETSLLVKQNRRIMDGFLSDLKNENKLDKLISNLNNREMIDKIFSNLKNEGSTDISDFIASQMSFGFWQSLIERKEYENSVWKPCCKNIFSHANSYELNLKSIRKKTKSILNLRNNVFHHGAIWNNSNIWSIYKDICQLISWMSPEIYKWSKKFDHFEEVYDKTTKLLNILHK